MRELPYRIDAGGDALADSSADGAGDELDAKIEIEEHDGTALVRIGSHTVEVESVQVGERYVTLTVAGKRHRVLYHTERGHVHVAFGGTGLEFVPAEEAAAASGTATGAFTPRITSPMPGKILDVPVSVGDTVEADQPLVLLEAMKMENTLRAVAAARVVSVDVAVGEMVAPGDTLLVLEALAADDDDAG